MDTILIRNDSNGKPRNYLQNIAQTPLFLYISFKLVEQSLIVRLGFLSLVDVISPTMKPNSFLGSNLHFFYILNQ